MPKTQLMRQDKWPLAEKGIHEGGKNEYGRQHQQQNRNTQGSGNFRGHQRGFRGGGRSKTRGRGFQGGRGNFQQQSNNQWHENAHDQPGPSNQNSNNNNRGKSKNKRPWGGGGRGSGNQ
jgi:hypothetical protein